MTPQIVPFTVVESSGARSPDVIAALPLIEAASELLLDCASAGAVGVIAGPPGSGKSVALRRLAARYPTLGLTGEAFYFCCQSNCGPTRGVKDLLTDMGIGGALLANGSGSSLQLLFKIAVRDFERKNIRCLLLDETDRWNGDAIAGILALHDHLRERGHPISLVMASMSEAPSWLDENDAARSRTLRVLHAERILASEMVGLLALWSEDFAKFAAEPDDALSHTIYEHTGPDLRRLNFFARLHARHFRGRGVSAESVKATLKRLDE